MLLGPTLSVTDDWILLTHYVCNAATLITHFIFLIGHWSAWEDV